MKMYFRDWLAALVVLMWSVAALQAQTSSGSVNGTVTDSTGAVIPGAAVDLVGADTGVARHAVTGGVGSFTFINVQPGNYTLRVSFSGFKTNQSPVFPVDVNQTVTQNQTLQPGATGETVQVSSSVEGNLTQRSSSELGTVIETKEVQQLPLNGRNFTQLLILTPGVTPVSTAQGSGVSTTDSGVTGIPGTTFYKPAIFGQQNRSTMYLLDGINNTDFRTSIYGFLPIIDATSEFKVQSHNDKAEYGGVVGGVVNMASRSGTNQFHGSAWEFVRNNIFDARNPFTDFCTPLRCGAGSLTTTPAAPAHYTQNEFGAAVGGPIFKEKTFFFGAYEGWRYTKPTLSTALVPTAAEINGDFSQSYYTQQIYNPNSTACVGTSCTVQPFRCDVAGNALPVSGNGTQPAGGTPCNKLPAGVLSPQMQKYMTAYYQQPNSATGPAYSYNYIEQRPQIDNNNSWQLRLDHHFSDRNFGFFRISQMWVHDVQPVTATIESAVSDYHVYNIGGGFTHAFTDHLFLDARGGVMLKPYVFSQSAAPNGFAAATAAGFNGLGTYGGMVINLGGPYTTSAAGNQGISNRNNPVISGGVDVSWLRGRHNIKGGAAYLYQSRLQSNLQQVFGFSDSITSNINASKTGNSLASALLGFPATFSAETPQYGTVELHLATISGYLQDEWKVTQNLTLNLGVRYDYGTPVVVDNQRLANQMDFYKQTYNIGATAVPACATSGAFVNPCIPNGIGSVPYGDHIVFRGDTKDVLPGLTDNAGPRVGFAWQFRPNSVLRGGYGLVYDTITGRSQYAQNSVEGLAWPYTKGITNQTTNVQTSGIWPGGAGNSLVGITSLAGNFPNPVIAASPWLTSAYMTAPDYSDARSHQYNLEVQQQLTPSIIFMVGYAGSKNDRLSYSGKINAARQASPAGTPAATIDALKLIPWSSPSWTYSSSTGYSNYNALLVQFQKRFSQSLSTIASYTWSKCMDNSSGFFGVENGTGGGTVVQNYFNPGNAYGVCGYNIPHYLTWSTNYSLPFGHGQRWLNQGVLSYVFGGIRMNYVFQARSGQPYNLGVGGDPANISGNNGTVSGYSRPNMIGDPHTGTCGATAIGAKSASGYCVFNPSAFSIPSGAFGNMGRGVLRTSSYNNLDFSLIKVTPLTERFNLELRAEAFNLYNAQILSAPGTTIGNSSAGFVTGLASTPRQLQMAAKITF
ncbi:MAG: carboxypeptidase regulatory-like domain-containing protein [Acidobacteria bacterium]|nr:carboxypeptidase regulatory-like domain-containing protein [Acidobacteriota bacterium]